MSNDEIPICQFYETNDHLDYKIVTRKSNVCR